MKNLQIAEVFRSIAELLEIKGDNPFRIRAYLRAAENIENLKSDVESYALDGRLNEIAGIGSDLAKKIQEIISTGSCSEYEKLKKLVPGGVVEMLGIPSVGPKSAKLFFEKLSIKSVAQLEKAAKNGSLLKLEGVKQKSVDNILKGIALLKKGKEKIDLLSASAICDSVLAGLKKVANADEISIAGSFRRGKEAVRDIDVLVSSKSPKIVSDKFTHLDIVKRVIAEGKTKSVILTKNDVQVDLRVVKPNEYGAALVYFTGSKNHNIRLRSLAIKKGLKINEYGVFDKNDRCLASKTEEEVYKSLGLGFIPPELREDAGEIEAALENKLPLLVDLDDIRGDFHAHSNYSDGEDTIETMARSAKEIGYEYLCLTDHSLSLRVANGLDKNRLKEKRVEIDRINTKMRNFRILFGSEVEIDSDGNIDYDNDVLSGFDVVIGAIHSGFKQPKKQLTKRIVKACMNKYVHIIAHPTGRLWPTRESYDIDFEEVFKVASQTNTALEINAHPYRLDLPDIHVRKAKEYGVKFAVNTDSHASAHLNYMIFGVRLARRAWLEKKDVLNSLSLKKMLEAIKK